MKRFEKFMRHGILVARTSMVLFLFFAVLPSMAGEKPEEGYLGVSIEKLSDEDLKELDLSFGVRVIDVAEGQAAEKAGIREDDIIQYFDEKKIEIPGDLVKAVRGTKPTSSVMIGLVRDKKSLKVTAILGKAQQFGFLHVSPDRKFKFRFFRDQAYLGVNLQDLNPELADYFRVKPEDGVLVLKVEADSPAEKAGLKAGDVIIQLNDKPVKVAGDVIKLIAEMEGGDKLELTFIRHGKKAKAKAELGKRKGFPGMKTFRWNDGNHYRMVIPEISIPEFEVVIPDLDKCKVIIHEKLRKAERKMKDVEKKIRRKLESIRECLYI